ncbi:hypothetical protein LSAT2_009645 [Lamellibrachia satsuma]|nr:hypothetical protein LSAT2_009645 [Lamellibrachia satsuma]
MTKTRVEQYALKQLQFDFTQGLYWSEVSKDAHEDEVTWLAGAATRERTHSGATYELFGCRQMTSSEGSVERATGELRCRVDVQLDNKYTVCQN